MPEQNVPPAPVRTAQRMSSLPSISSQASAMPTSMGRLSAFLASGRFIVTTAVAPSRSNVRCSVIHGPRLEVGAVSGDSPTAGVGGRPRS